MVAISVLPILVLLIAGFLALIVFAIVRKKWAILFIPLGLVAVLAVAAFVVPTASQYKHNSSYSTAEHPVNNTSNVRQYGVEVSRSNDSGKDVRTIHVNSKNGNSVLVSKQNGNSTVHVNSSNGSVEVTRNQPNASHEQIRYKTGMISLILLMFLLVLAVLVVIAIARRKWALLFIPLGVGALVYIGVLTLTVGHLSDRSEQIAVIERSARMPEVDNPSPIQLTAVDGNTASQPAYDKPLPSVWSPGMEKEFSSNIYYSKTSALKAVARRIEKTVRQMALNGQKIPEEISMVALKDKFNQEMVDEAIKIFKEVVPEIEFNKVVAGKRTFTRDDNWISLDSNESPAQPAYDYTNGERMNMYIKESDFTRGTIKASIRFQGKSFTVEPTFVTKPWLENFSVFQSSIPQRRFAIAYSQSSCNSSDWAQKQAVSQAQQIVNRMIMDIQRTMPRSSHSMEGFSPSYDELVHHGIIADNFHQMFSSSTTIHRHACLLDISPDRIMPLAEKKIKGYNADRRSWAYHIMSAIGIALVICVIYLILNAATKGYYTAVLRILTVIGIIVVVLLLTMV